MTIDVDGGLALALRKISAGVPLTNAERERLIRYYEDRIGAGLVLDTTEEQRYARLLIEAGAA